MCTILILQRVCPDYPLVLGTNRDEFFDRPATGAVRLLEQPVVVGGRDLKAGGTWMGVRADGLFVGVTNQRTETPPDPGLRSRGDLVMEALQCDDVVDLKRWVREQDGRHFNSFNLLFGNAKHGLTAAYGRVQERSVRLQSVPDGVHVLPNGSLDSPDFAKVARARSILDPVSAAPWPQLEQRLIAALADRQTHDPDPGTPTEARPWARHLTALCVRTEKYGTRSSTVVALQEGTVARYKYADGPPDQTPFEDVRPLFSHSAS